MRMLYLASVWMHLLAVTAWVGGMFFLVLVLVPWLNRGDRAKAGAVLRETGMRFRRVCWICFGVLLATGTFNLWMRGVRLENLVDADWLATPFGKTLAVKLAVFASVVVLSAYHDFAVGPRAAAAIEANPQSPEAEKLRRRASWFGMLNGLLALVLVGLAVRLVRG